MPNDAGIAAAGWMPEDAGTGAGSGEASGPALHPVRIFMGSGPESHSFPAGVRTPRWLLWSANDSREEAPARLG